MEIKIIEEKENPLLNRTEIRFECDYEGEGTPKILDVKHKLVAIVNASKERVGAVDWFINRNIWENIIIKQFPSVLRGQITPETVYELVDEAMVQMS